MTSNHGAANQGATGDEFPDEHMDAVTRIATEALGLEIDSSPDLSLAESRVVAGALTYWHLIKGARRLRLALLRGAPGDPADVTSESLLSGQWADSTAPIGMLEAGPAKDQTAPDSEPAASTEPPLLVNIRLPAPVPAPAAPPGGAGRLGRVRAAVRRHAPVVFDEMRQWRTDRVEQRQGGRPIPRKRGYPVTAASRPPSGRPPAILFGLHWLEMGGAERWAIESVRLAHEAGATPIVITDRPSTHPWLSREELDGSLVIPLGPGHRSGEGNLLGGLMDSYDIRGVHVHHCSWLYNRLPLLRMLDPALPIVDTTHIVEWRTGGFVHISGRMQDYIDVHHVISPHLRDYMEARLEIPAAKVALAPLAELTTHHLRPRQPDASEPFTVTFVGRFTQQKRPYLFLELCRRVHRLWDEERMGRPVRFVMHGDGDLAYQVEALRQRFGLGDVLELRGPERPVGETLDASDVLVVTSDNEGLALTCFEASSAGVPIISTDVGSQASVVADDLLMPRHAGPFLERAVPAVGRIATSPQWLGAQLREQSAKVRGVEAYEPASAWAERTYREWLT